MIEVEEAAFTPSVFTTSGGMGPECERLNKRLGELIAAKSKEKYAHIMMHIRTGLRFALLKATLVAVRGYRGKDVTSRQDEDEIDFNLIPHDEPYEPL